MHIYRRMSQTMNYMYLAITTGSSTSISITYIAFLTEMQKRQTPEKGFALHQKRNTTTAV